MDRRRERASELRRRWRKFAGFDLILESGTLVRTVAEGLIGGLAAAAQGDHFAPCESELVSLGVENLEISFDPDGSVVVNRYLGIRHSIL